MLHRPLKAQLVAFAKMGIHLPGRPSHTHIQPLCFIFQSSWSKPPADQKEKWRVETDCSDLLLWYAVLFVLALQIYLVNCHLL